VVSFSLLSALAARDAFLGLHPIPRLR